VPFHLSKALKSNGDRSHFMGWCNGEL